MINTFESGLVKLLDAVTVAGAGEVASTNSTYHAFQLLTAKGSTITLEGSLNGTDFKSLGTLNTNKDILQVTGVFMAIRANVTSFSSGDTITLIYRGNK